MALKREYQDYLKHFGQTVCLREFAQSTENAIGLRHDIDHCIDTALEMAFWEADAGIRSSYFILGTAPYRDDPRLLDKCLQIQAFGHEVGIHTNSITRWYEEDVDPYESFEEELARFRNAGIDVTGTSAHGDAKCYQSGFINYWLFEELRTEDVGQRESSLNAEGIVEQDPDKRITYPGNHELVRADGKVLKLWGRSQAQLGLTYEASHLSSDAYYSDSGGLWKRTPDPLGENLQEKRVQVLIHPIHWKAPRKIYFFLSTARSGSKWLSNLLDQASSCDARHEYTLNHFTDKNGQVLAEKMTGTRLHELLADNQKIEAGLAHSRDQVDDQLHDYAEANVYLPVIFDEFKARFPDARLIHLLRNPADVVRSIMNRGWYDTPDDSAHPANLEENWARLSPFEKCCSYVWATNALLSKNCDVRIDFDAVTTDCSYLETHLKRLGIAYYPLLAEPLFSKKMNANALDSFPEYSDWSPQQKDSFNRYMGSEAAIPAGESHATQRQPGIRGLLRGLAASWLPQRTGLSEVLEAQDFSWSPEQLSTLCHAQNASVKTGPEGLQVMPLNGDKNAHVMLGGKGWTRLKRKAGWKMQANGYYTLSMNTRLNRDAKVTVFCIYYGDNRKQIYKRAVGILPVGENAVSFSFAMMGFSRYFNLALYLPSQDTMPDLVVNEVELRFSGYD